MLTWLHATYLLKFPKTNLEFVSFQTFQKSFIKCNFFFLVFNFFIKVAWADVGPC